MRKCNLGLVILILILPGCYSEPTDYSNSFNRETDYAYFFHGDGEGTRIASSDQGYYFLNGSYLYYTDKDKMKPVLLDNNPDSTCLEEGADEKRCGAYVNIGVKDGFVAYYDDRLYTLQTKTTFVQSERKESAELIRMEKDGSKRKKVLSFDFIPKSIAIHRGMVYYSLRDFNKDAEAKVQMLQYNLHGFFAEPKVIFDGDLPNGDVQDIIPYGNQVYFYHTGKNIVRVMRYDIQQKTISRLFSDDDQVYPFLKAISNNNLLFSYFYGDIEDPRTLSTYSSDLAGGHIGNYLWRESSYRIPMQVKGIISHDRFGFIFN
jgi:hypothetical protein